MLVLVVGLAALPACGDSGDGAMNEGEAGGGGDAGGKGGAGGDGGKGEDEGGGKGGGDEGVGGNGGADEEEGEPTACEEACARAEVDCRWIDGSAPDADEVRAVCVALCEERTECVTDAIATCSEKGIEPCFVSPDETPECAAFCDQVYYECGFTFGYGRVQCGLACLQGKFSEEQVACVTISSCELEEMNACLGGEEESDS